MKIVICDDEENQLALLQKMIAKEETALGQKFVLSAYTNCDDLWWDVQDGLQADLFLLDIQMQHTTGMELAHKMRASGNQAMICFITGVKEYVFEGYDVNAIGYILKPYEQMQIHRILEKATALCKEVHADVVLKTSEGTLRLVQDDVVALEARAHDTNVYLVGGEILVKKGLHELVQDFDAIALTKIHRSFLVNMKQINTIQKGACKDSQGRTYPIARSAQETAFQAFINANKREF